MIAITQSATPHETISSASARASPSMSKMIPTAENVMANSPARRNGPRR